MESRKQDTRADHFGFAPASGWYTSSTGLYPDPPQVPAATASTIPLEEPVVGELPLETLKHLPKSGVIVWVGASQRPPWGHFPAGSLPPQLGDADVRSGWEGQPNADAPEYLILRYVNGFNLETRVYFGRQHPSDEQASRAQQELDRLELPLNTAAPKRSARAAPRVHWRHSLSLGRPYHGSLVRGVRFPAEGRTFFTWDPILLRSPDRPWRRYGNDRLVRIVLRVLAGYARDHPEAPRVGIGDFSRPHGGPFGPKHASHQNGLDVDVYYPRLDRRERAPTRAAQIDRRLAQDLLDRFLRAGVARIFVGPNTHLTGPPRIVQVLAHHDNHMHVRIAPGTRPAPAAYTAPLPSERIALVTAERQNQLIAVDLRSRRVLRRLRMPDDPQNVEASAGEAVVVSAQAGAVTFVDPRTLKVRRILHGFGAPHIAAFAPGGDYVYVSDDERGQLAVVLGRVIRRIFVGYGAHHMSFSPDQRRLWVALGERARSIAVVDTRSVARPRLVGHVDPRGLAHDLAFTPDGHFVWVTYDDRSDLRVFDARTRRPVATLFAGAAPAHVRFDDASGLSLFGRYAYVAGGNSSAVRIFDWRARRLVRTIRTAPGSYNLSVDRGLLATSSLTDGIVTVVHGGRRIFSERVAPAARDVALAVH
jgi:DNA-binding beta-propeller fold protein YncE